MKDIKKNKIENKLSIITGIILGFGYSFYLTELLQYSIVSLLPVNALHFEFIGINLYSLFYLNQNEGILVSTITYLSPYLVTIAFSEAIIFILKKTTIGFSRFLMIIFLIIITGYFIFSVFYGGISTILEAHSYNDIALFFSHLKLSEIKELGVIFLFVFITLGYISSLFKRIQEYITSY